MREEARTEYEINAVPRHSRIKVEGKHLPVASCEIRAEVNKHTLTTLGSRIRKGEMAVVEGLFTKDPDEASSGEVHHIRIEFGPTHHECFVYLDRQGIPVSEVWAYLDAAARHTEVGFTRIIHATTDDGKRKRFEEEVSGYLLAASLDKPDESEREEVKS